MIAAGVAAALWSIGSSASAYWTLGVGLMVSSGCCCQPFTCEWFFRFFTNVDDPVHWSIVSGSFDWSTSEGVMIAETANSRALLIHPQPAGKANMRITMGFFIYADEHTPGDTFRIEFASDGVDSYHFLEFILGDGDTVHGSSRLWRRVEGVETFLYDYNHDIGTNHFGLSVQICCDEATGSVQASIETIYGYAHQGVSGETLAGPHVGWGTTTTSKPFRAYFIQCERTDSVCRPCIRYCDICPEDEDGNLSDYVQGDIMGIVNFNPPQTANDCDELNGTIIYRTDIVNYCHRVPPLTPLGHWYTIGLLEVFLGTVSADVLSVQAGYRLLDIFNYDKLISWQLNGITSCRFTNVVMPFRANLYTGFICDGSLSTNTLNDI